MSDVEHIEGDARPERLTFDIKIDRRFMPYTRRY